jgi:hypothetical protein
VRRCEEPFWRGKARGRQKVKQRTQQQMNGKIVEEGWDVADFYVDRCLTRLERYRTWELGKGKAKRVCGVEAEENVCVSWINFPSRRSLDGGSVKYYFVCS